MHVVLLIMKTVQQNVINNCRIHSHFFSKKFQHICVSLDVNFNELLTNDIVIFEQLGPGMALCSCNHNKSMRLPLETKNTLQIENGSLGFIETLFTCKL